MTIQKVSLAISRPTTANCVAAACLAAVICMSMLQYVALVSGCWLLLNKLRCKPMYILGLYTCTVAKVIFLYKCLMHAGQCAGMVDC